MKQKNTPMVRLLSSGLAVAFVALFLCISLVAFSGMNRSTAWFSLNTNVSANGMSVSVDDPLTIDATLTSYAISEISDNKYTLSDEGIYTLPTNDPNSISYSEYEKALAVVIEAEAAYDTSINIILSTPHTDLSFDDQNFISNCIKISTASLDTQSNVATINGSAQSFVTIENSTYTKDSSLTLCSVSLSEATPTKICFIIEYNQTFLEFFSNYILEQGLTISTVDFANDIEFQISTD